MWMRRLKRLTLLAVLSIGALLGTARWAVQQTRKVPDFYERAVGSEPEANLQRSSEQLEANVKRLQHDIAESGLWDASFTTQQINAWLSRQLPLRFPTLAARGLQEPRIQIEDNRAVVAARYRDHRFDAVLSCELSVQLTDHPNRLAVTVESIKAGALPLPVSRFKERIVQFAERAKIALEWDEEADGGSTALLDLAIGSPGTDDDPRVIEWIELADQQLSVAGRSGQGLDTVFRPRGPVYKLASVEGSSASTSKSIRSFHAEGVVAETSTQ